MSPLKPFLLALAIGPSAWQLASAQDYVGYVEQLAAQAGQQAQMHAQNAIQLYRQQTGDWSTPDQQVLAYLDAMSRQQNPGFYSDLQQREQAFQAQQGAYVNNSNAVLDGMYNSYMDRSAMQYQGQQDYVREGIWERSRYTDGNAVYELPNYQPGQVYEGYDGSTMIQDDYGQYQHYDAYGWQTEMEEYD
ncbi:MAG: hypothetical protein K9L70_03745 [Thiohalocapsa sp.]|nr:hypothetical protein [Thiohalocapsa sp.]